MNKWILVVIASAIGASLGLLHGCAYEVRSADTAIDYLGAPPTFETPEAAREWVERKAKELEIAVGQQAGRIQAVEARRDAVNAFGLGILGPVLDQIGTIAQETPGAGAALGAAVLGAPTLLAAFGVVPPGSVKRKDILTEYISRTEHAEILRQQKESSYVKGVQDGRAMALPRT